MEVIQATWQPHVLVTPVVFPDNLPHPEWPGRPKRLAELGRFLQSACERHASGLNVFFI